MRWVPVLLMYISAALPVFAQTTGNNLPLGNNPSGRSYRIRGISMYTETYGTGQPLLFIHGNGGSMKDFEHQVPFFLKNYKVILADSRAQGRSADKSDSLTYEQMADDFAALLDSMKIDSAFVIGWSDGGINAILLALRHPQKVKKMAITGANLWPDSTAVHQEIIDMIRAPYDSLKARRVQDEKEKNQVKLLRLMIEQPNIRADELKSVKCPALVIGGDNDVIKEEHTMQIYKSIPKAWLWILPNSGHSTLIRYKDQFNATVADFFAKEFEPIRREKRFY